MGRTKVLSEGLFVGLAGAACVALWFFLYDAAAGTPLRTPALLGAALFHGLRDPAALVITPSLVLQYTLFHGLVLCSPRGCSTPWSRGPSSERISSPPWSCWDSSSCTTSAPSKK